MGFAVAGGIIAGSVASGYFGNQAANTQAAAEQHAADVQMQIYQQQRADLQPYTQAGYSALNQIQANMPEYNRPFTISDFYQNQDPGYQFRLSQGENAVNRAAAASGGAVGASALQSLGNYAQSAASQEYQNAFQRYQQQIQNSYSRLAGVAGLGQGATQTGVQAGTAAGQGIASSIANMGGARAGGQVAIGNAITSGIGQGIGAYQGSQLTNAIGEQGLVNEFNNTSFGPAPGGRVDASMPPPRGLASIAAPTSTVGSVGQPALAQLAAG